jgi:hypothetical protein
MNPRLYSSSITTTLATLTALVAPATLAGCDEGSGPPSAGSSYVLASVVIDADGNRTTYVQMIDSLDAGPFTNASAIELPGNGVVMARGGSFYVGLAEEPTWIRYSLDGTGGIQETGRLSFLNLGATYIDYGNAIVDDQTAVSVLSNPPVAVVWNPDTMTIRGEIPLAHLARDGYELEVWTTVAHDGRVYVPGRWSDWEGGRIFPAASLTILDPATMKIAGIAEDDRCASSGRPVFDADGYAYVMGDGRNYSIQMFANAGGGTAPDNCLLRIPPGGTDFEAGYYYKIPSLTGGLQSITELETARQGSGLGFAKMFYPDQLPPGVEPVDFAFWNERAHKMWRLRLADPPVAEVVQDIPFSAIGFEGSVLDGYLFTGESPDGATSEVFEIDPETNRARPRFTMDGYFNGLYKLAR